MTKTIKAPRLLATQGRKRLAARPRRNPRTRRNPSAFVDVSQLQFLADQEALAEDLKFIFRPYLELYRTLEGIAKLDAEERKSLEIRRAYQGNITEMIRLLVLACTMVNVLGGDKEWSPEAIVEMADDQFSQLVNGSYRFELQTMDAAPWGKLQFRYYIDEDWIPRVRSMQSPGAVLEVMIIMLRTAIPVIELPQYIIDAWEMLLRRATVTDDGDPAAYKMLEDVSTVARSGGTPAEWSGDNELHRLFFQVHDRDVMGFEWFSFALKSAYLRGKRGEKR